MALSLFCECSGDSSTTFSHRFEKGASNRKTIQSDLGKKDSLPSWHFFVRHVYQMQIITVISLSLGQSLSFPWHPSKTLSQWLIPWKVHLQKMNNPSMCCIQQIPEILRYQSGVNSGPYWGEGAGRHHSVNIAGIVTVFGGKNLIIQVRISHHNSLTTHTHKLTLVLSAADKWDLLPNEKNALRKLQIYKVIFCLGIEESP